MSEPGADAGNAGRLGPAAFRETSTRLDELIQRAGREPGAVRRTLMQQVVCYRNDAELRGRLQWLATRMPGLPEPSPTELLAALRRRAPNAIVGTPSEVIDQIHAYGEAGVEEITVQRLDLDDIEGLQIIAEEILPHVAA